MARCAIRTDRRPLGGLVLALMPAALAVTIPMTAGAAASPVSSTWRGADPTAYDHATGGGHWSDGKASLTPYATAWTCGDVVSHLLRLDVRSGVATTAAKISISMTSDSTGQSGIALVPIVGGVSIDATDPAQAGNGDSAITGFAAVTSGSPLSSGATSSVGFTVTNLDAAETVVVRVDLRIICNDTATATGNVQASVDTVTNLEGTVSYLSGAQTVPAKKALPGGTTTTTTAPPATTTTTPPATTTTAPPVTTTTAPPVTTTTVIPDPFATTTTTAVGPTTSTLPTEVLNEEAENTSTTAAVATAGAELASTGGTLHLALLGVSAVSIGVWFVAGTRRRRPAQD
jgi:hypothetical protein